MTVNKKTFIILWALCILGGWSVLPCLHHLGVLPSTISIWKMALVGTVQAVLFYGLISWISFKLLPKTDLRPFPTVNRNRFLKQIVYPAFVAGVLVGLALFVFDTTIFNRSVLSGVHPQLWASALASVYGAVNEEVLLRLFLFTLIYFLVGKCLTIRESNRLAILWGVNIFVALIFGVGHLPAAFKLMSPSAFEIFRILFLNGVAGIVFGWLYWSKGLWTAIGAHFIADIMIHVLLV